MELMESGAGARAGRQTVVFTSYPSFDGSLLGVRVRLISNSPEVLDLAKGVLDPLSHADPNAPSVRLKCWLVDERDSDPDQVLSSVRFERNEDCFSLQVGVSSVAADRRRGEAIMQLSRDLLERRAFFQENLIECVLLFLGSRYRPATMHAAALSYAGCGVLLTGTNGSGKSTLSCACVRAGFRIAAEDIAFIDDGASELVAWGCGRYLHLLPEACRFFNWLPAADRLTSIKRLNGEEKFRIPIDVIREGASLSRTRLCAVALLNRTSGNETRIDDADPAAVRKSLTGIEGDPPVCRPAMERAADRLLALPLIRLKVGDDPGSTALLFRTWIESRFR